MARQNNACTQTSWSNRTPLLLTAFLIHNLFTFTACSFLEGAEHSPEPVGATDDGGSYSDFPGLTREQAAALDLLESPRVESDKIYLQPDGISLRDYVRIHGLERSTPQEVAQPPTCNAPPTSVPVVSGGPLKQKQAVVALMLDQAEKYTKDELWTFPSGADPVLEPAQKGLAYSYGGRDPCTREKSFKCNERIYGLDCSGMIKGEALAAGIVLPNDTSTAYAKPELWNKVLPSDWNLVMGPKPDGAYEDGDIVYWDGPGHIGLVFIQNGRTMVFQSNGSPSTASAECIQNISDRRGPRPLSLNDLMTGNGWKLGQPTTALRLYSALSGQWIAYTRCAGEKTVSLYGDIKVTENDGATARKGFHFGCYSGPHGYLDISGRYMANSGTLAGSVSIYSVAPGDVITSDLLRSDSFAVPIHSKDTGWVPTTTLKNTGAIPCFPASCRLEIRLIKGDFVDDDVYYGRR